MKKFKPHCLFPKTKKCPKCNANLCQVKPAKPRPEDPRPKRVWVNNDGDFSVHECETKIKVFSPEEIAELNAKL